MKTFYFHCKLGWTLFHFWQVSSPSCCRVANTLQQWSHWQLCSDFQDVNKHETSRRLHSHMSEIHLVNNNYSCGLMELLKIIVLWFMNWTGQSNTNIWCNVWMLADIETVDNNGWSIWGQYHPPRHNLMILIRVLPRSYHDSITQADTWTSQQ